MNARMKLAVPLMLATASALAATGFATRTDPVSAAQTPAQATYVEPMANDISAAPAASEAYMAPAPRQYVAPRVTVTAPRPSEDELLRNAVMDRLSGDARLAGRIGVEAYRHTVSLTGRVTTTGQVERAGTIARSVAGVQDVNNLLQARVGNI